MNINDLTPEQRAQLQKQLKEQAADEQAAKMQKEKDYKSLAADTVDQIFPQLTSASAQLKALKSKVVDEFAAIIDLKTELYTERSSQKSHTFSSPDGNRRITTGYYERDAWDDTAGQGEELVKKAIQKLATDDKTGALVEVIMKLLSKDKAGNLKIKQVLELQNLSERINDPDLAEGVRIIRHAYRPERTKTFIIAEHRESADSGWKNVPLGITEA